MRWKKVLCLIALAVVFISGEFFIYWLAKPGEFEPVSFEPPKSSNPNIGQQFIEGSVIKEGMKVHDPPLVKEIFREKDFETIFLNYSLTESNRKVIYLNWQAVNPDNEQEVFIAAEEINLPPIKELNLIKTVKFQFEEQKIIIETKTYDLLALLFSSILVGMTIILGFCIVQFIR